MMMQDVGFCKGLGLTNSMDEGTMGDGITRVSKFELRNRALMDLFLIRHT